MPNRRRRKLSTAMSAVAALAVASPFAVTAVSELTASSKPAPEQHDFVQAAMVTDLPGEIMSALQSSLSQFGVVVPNMPSGIMGQTGTPTTPALTPGGLTAPGAATGLTAPTATGLTAPTATGLTAPTATGLTSPTATGLTAPTAADLSNPSLANTALTPGTAPGLPGTTPANPTTPGLTTPTTPTAPGLTPAAGVNPALTSPLGTTQGLTGSPNEVPISTQTGADPQTFPLLGASDPSMGTGGLSSGLGGLSSAAPSGGGGLMSDLSNAASQLGATQAIDLLKGVVVPSIMQAIKGAAPAAAAPAAAAPAPLPTP